MNDFLRTRDGKPFFAAGLQSHNSSTGTRLIEKTMDAIALYHGNTMEAPVYWYQLEPEQDVYDMSLVQGLIDQARSRGLYLIILWFGANKNGHPNYAPEYIKLHPEIYRIAVSADGSPAPSISPHCSELLQRDLKAFKRFISFLKEYDDGETVLAVQIENEFGYGQTDRDYSELAEADYQKGVPEALLGTEIEDCGELSHDGTWVGEFGIHANEVFSSWYTASFVEALAKAGKEILPISYTVNIAIGESGIEMPGFSYNAGAGVGRMLDVWKIAAPHLDLICPDIYLSGRRVYERICSRYDRPDNALFIPESATGGDANAMNMFLAAGKYGATGLFAFGAESTLDENGQLLPEARKVAYSMKAITGLAPLLIKYRGTGRIHAFVQDEFTTEEYLKLPKYHVIAQFVKNNPNFRARSMFLNLRAPENAWLLQERGRGLLIQTDEDEFYLAGVGIGFDFRRRSESGDAKAYVHQGSRMSTQLNFLTVEEGHFEGDTFVRDAYRNGDETNYLAYSYDGTVVRIRLNPNTGMDLK